MSSPALIGVRCNPYGAETGGPKRLLGGLYRGASAATPGMDLPQAIAEGEWACRNMAQVRCRMTCRCGHKGQPMDLCSWHDEVTGHTELVAGTERWVSETVRVRGHFEEISRRQAGFCPPCGFPDSRSSPNRVDYAALHKEWEGIGANLYALAQAMGNPYAAMKSPMGRPMQQRRDDIGKMFDEARMLGIVHNCPLTLVPVS